MCGAENREGRRFCAQCGRALAAAICPACRAANEPGERFCGECGAPLTIGFSVAPTGSRTETVGEVGERKQLTVLFADVLASMDVQEHLDAEVWARIMGRLVDILAEGVHRFGGTVDKFTGDGIMALFGAPFAQEDHARRACLSSLSSSVHLPYDRVTERGGRHARVERVVLAEGRIATCGGHDGRRDPSCRSRSRA